MRNAQQAAQLNKCMPAAVAGLPALVCCKDPVLIMHTIQMRMLSRRRSSRTLLNE